MKLYFFFISPTNKMLAQEAKRLLGTSYNAIESVKNEDDVKPEKTTIHAAKVHEEKSVESHPLLPLLK